MFIQCSDCDYKYIVNSADLKPDGRMVECANCNHQWFQEPLQGEDLLTSLAPKTSQKKFYEDNESQPNNDKDVLSKEIKNLPSTIVKEQEVNLLNTFLVVFLVVFLFFLFWVFRSYGTNILVLVSFYFNEFFFNLKLIIDDFTKIIFQILN